MKLRQNETSSRSKNGPFLYGTRKQGNIVVLLIKANIQDDDYNWNDSLEACLMRKLAIGTVFPSKERK